MLRPVKGRGVPLFVERFGNGALPGQHPKPEVTRRKSPASEPPGASRREPKLPGAPAARGGEFRLVVSFCERGAVAPLSHFPPGYAGNEPEVRCHCFRWLRAAPEGRSARSAANDNRNVNLTPSLSSYTSNVPRIRFPTPPFPHLLPPSAAGFGGPHLLGDLYSDSAARGADLTACGETRAAFPSQTGWRSGSNPVLRPARSGVSAGLAPRSGNDTR